MDEVTRRELLEEGAQLIRDVVENDQEVVRSAAAGWTAGTSSGLDQRIINRCQAFLEKLEKTDEQ